MTEPEAPRLRRPRDTLALLLLAGGIALALATALTSLSSISLIQASTTTTVYVGDIWFCDSTDGDCPQPHVTDVPAGSTVRWEWVGSIPHTTTACADDTYAECGEQYGWDSGVVTEGSLEHTFGIDDAGKTFPYICEVHPSIQFGAINVEVPEGFLLWGDVDCDGQISIGDALKLARHLISLDVSQMPDCPLVGSDVDVDGTIRTFGDIGCTGTIGIGDALRIARYLVGLSVTQEPGCPEIGSLVEVSEAPIPFELESTLGPAFTWPLGVHPIPGSPGEALVIERGGKIFNVSLSTPFDRTLVGDLSSQVGTASEQGLLSLAFSPNFGMDSLVYLYYAPGSPEANATPAPSVLSSFTFGGEIDNEEIVLEIQQHANNHNGGTVLFGPDEFLYLSLGDGGGAGDPEGHGQDTTTLLGTVIRIDVLDQATYAIPPENPFVGDPGARDEIWAYGLRNPWRMSFDSLTGDLWLGDVGQGRWEEVNVIEDGENYGWNIMEGFDCYPPSTQCDQAGLELPVHVYPIAGQPECAIIGGYVYRGTQFPDLAGKYVFGDHCSGKIWALDTEGANPHVRLIAESPHQITSFAELPDGELLVLTPNNGIFRFMEAAGD